MNVQSLATSIRDAVNTRIDNEARAKRGFIKNGLFQTGAKSFPFKQAVECNLHGKLWAQLDKHGKAVIVGA